LWVLKQQAFNRARRAGTQENMITAASPFADAKSLDTLSRLLLRNPGPAGVPALALAQPDQEMAIAEISQQEFADLLALANSHHVVIRSMEILGRLNDAALNPSLAEWVARAIERENARIQNALSFLKAICGALQADACNVMVIKSLDHWPDLGSDLDLYTDAEPSRVIRSMARHFKARLASRSWGDRLANKWNFIVPGLPELVEVHMGRLGQTGEQVTLAASLLERARETLVAGLPFRVPAREDRLIICTLQRMYRHFYARLCDIVDTANLLETEPIDYDDLRSLAETSGTWEGVATFLGVVSDYVRFYRGRSVDLPSSVRLSATFGGDQLRFERGFLRIPILPHAARLYASQLTILMRKGELRSSARLSLLPCLATAAALGQTITGSDKGIW
jgi:hypothetical protein